MRVRSEKKRNEIIAIAGELFRSQGYGAVSMATIAAAVGGSKGTLYGYFPSKEELFTAFVITGGQERLAEFMALPEDVRKIDDRLKTLGFNYLRLLLSDEIMSLNRLVISEAKRFPELGRIFYENGAKIVIDRIAATMETLAAARELTIDDPSASAWRFKSLCEARLFEEFLWAIRTSVTDEEIMANVEPACEIFLQSYRAKSS